MNTKLLIATGTIIGVVVGIFAFMQITTPAPLTPVTRSSPEAAAEQAGTESSAASPVTSGMYIDYTAESYESNKDKKRVLFFHAAWCPTCKVANQEFTTKTDQIPSGVVLLKTDYDTTADLKKKYGITYQHTFVQVDTQGNELAKWNGGGVTELIENVK